MDPETSEPVNRYAPPAGEALSERTEPWTLGGSIAAAIRTSLKAPFLAWVALGAIPSLTAVPGMLELDDAESGLVLLVVMFVVSAVLAGGQYTIALALVRKQPASLRAFISHARSAPRFFALNLPAVVPSVLVYLIGAPEDPSDVAGFLILALVFTTFGGLYVMYRLSLATYALADSKLSLRQAVQHSWARIGANTGQFVGLFVITSLPFVVYFAFSVTVPPVGILFDAATLPIVTLCWAHVYDVNPSMADRAPS